MSKPYTVICHRCGKPTFVDLSRTISDQRCRSCKGFLQGVDVGMTEREAGRKRKLVVKMAGAAGDEPHWEDQAGAVVPLRQRWPRFFRWVIGTGIVLIAVIFVRIGIMKWQESAGGEAKSNFRQSDPVKVDTINTGEWVDKATAVAKKVIAAKTVGELLPFLYHPEVDDDVIRRYYGSEGTLPLGTDLNETEYVTAGGYKENVAAFQFVDTAGRQRAFVVVEKKDGMKVDWPSFVGLGEMSLKEYIRTAPPGVVVMRARARLGQYYNHFFSDAKRWLSVRLCDVTDENVIHAYYDLSLPGADTLAEELPNPAGKVPRPDVPVVVVLKNPSGNVFSDQTQLIAFISTTWYLEDGLKPLIEHARKLDAVRNAMNGDTPQPDKEEKPAPPPEYPPPAPQTPPP